MRELLARLRTVLKPHTAAKVSGANVIGTSNGERVGDRPLFDARDPSAGLLPGRGNRLHSQLYGAAILLVTTVLWASGGPTTKFLFLLPTPPSAALLTACISVITALFLGVGLIGSAMDGGRAGCRVPAATVEVGAQTAASGTIAAAGARLATRRKCSGPEVEADEAEAEALLHSGMHTTGAAGGALAAACAAAREVAQERDRERMLWSQGHECVLPLLPSHDSYYCSSLSHHNRVEQADSESGRAAVARMLPAEDFISTHRLSSGASLSDAGPSGREGDAGRSTGTGWASLYERRGPSLDGTVAGRSVTSPRSPSRPPHGDHLGRLPGASRSGDGGPRVRSTGSGGGAAGSGPGHWRVRLLTAPARSLPAAGLELGIYNVTAAALGAWGMQRISATRSAFLAQATSLLTPLLVWLSGGRVGLMVWIACCCGAMGGAMVALDNIYGAAAVAEAAAGSTASNGHARHLLTLLYNALDLPAGGVRDSSSSTGGAVHPSVASANLVEGHRTLLSSGRVEAAAAPLAVAGGHWQVEGVLLSRQAMGAAYVLLSCVFWGLGTVRLGVHSACYRPLHLAAAAGMCYAGLSLLWLFCEILGSPSAGLSDFLELGLLLRNHVSAALLLWAGLGPGALSSYLQALGQQTVPPAQAQVLFSSTPLWSALIAQLLLPGEAMGPLAWLGGAIMLGASLLASLWQ